MYIHYDRTRRSDPYALPDIEIFRGVMCATCGEPTGHTGSLEGHVHKYGPTNHAFKPTWGWYWWACFPGCLPDGDPVGPFPSIYRAARDARRS